MSIQGVNAFPILPHGPAAAPRAAAPAAPAAPAAAPPAFELTAEERAYFARIAELGQVTYGPRSQPAAPAPLGQRIDARA
jgi:hypothetical protein